MSPLKKALQLKPNNPKAHNNLGIALKEQGDLDAAIASYNTALRFQPDFPQAHCKLGNALQQQGDLDAAIAS
ncbi:tetratricopeptide repeat protein, partial [Synechococcus sp. AH-603-M21]|nr:tetratricopeptide repeat protein [Synechococcus sp. AH-603-M21]